MERIQCNKCGKSVSSEVPDNTIVRAWVECPECVSSSSTQDDLLSKIETLEEKIQALEKEKNNRPYNIYWNSTQSMFPQKFHPLTCGKNRTDEAHKAYQAEHGGDFGELVATPEGWMCPVPGCGYTQNNKFSH